MFSWRVMLHSLSKGAALTRNVRSFSGLDPPIDITIDPSALSMPKPKRQTKKNKDKTKKKNRPFVDRIRICVKGGDGGRGSLSHESMSRKGHLRPNGGHGGDGGSVIIVADPKKHLLVRESPHIIAQDGGNGQKNNAHGRTGANTIVRVPPGIIVKRVLQWDEEYDEETSTIRKITNDTPDEFANFSYVDEYGDEQDREDLGPVPVVVPRPDPPRQQFSKGKDPFDEETDFEDNNDRKKGDDDIKAVDSDSDADEADEDGEEIEEERMTFTLADLDKPGAHLIVARGGRGGVGSGAYASRSGPKHPDWLQRKRSQPSSGEVVHLELELKLIADLGLVGFPNAGKSSLLNAMSKASPAVAPYPFTTLHPLTGLIEYQDGYRVKAADIPGLIEGASRGRGKGFEFLKHVERTKALLYIVDAASVDLRDPIEDLQILANELSSYGDGSLMERRALVVANKLDLLHKDHAKEVKSKLRKAATECGIQFEGGIYGISAGVTGEGLGKLAKAIRHVVSMTEKDRQEDFEESLERLPL